MPKRVSVHCYLGIKSSESIAAVSLDPPDMRDDPDVALSLHVKESTSNCCRIPKNIKVNPKP